MSSSAAPTTTIPDTLRLLKARELANQGRLREAEALLGGAENPSADPSLLHHLAVIVTRQGDYPRARRLWRQLEQVRPGDAEALRMIDAIETWQDRPVWVGYVPAGAACLLVALLALILWPRGGESTHATPTPIQPLATVPVTPVAPVRTAPVNTIPTPPPRQVAPAEPAPMVTFELPPPKARR